MPEWLTVSEKESIVVNKKIHKLKSTILKRETSINATGNSEMKKKKKENVRPL